jgi:hypothetical protein
LCMERWNRDTYKNVENPKIDAFLQEVIEVSIKHGFSIAHEDSHGAFIVEAAYKPNFDWLMEASDGTEPGEGN